MKKKYSKSLFPLFGISMMFFVLNCKNTEFKGTPPETQKDSDAEKTPEISDRSPVALPSNQPVVIEPNIIPTPSVEPTEVVDGQEVFTDCDKCVARAKQLSPQANFTADISQTINMGFYKIEPSRNLCDVHFLKGLNVKIDDHDAVDTIGNEQIILYCPCNCSWAQGSITDNTDTFFP